MLKRGHFRISDSGLTPLPQPVPSTHWSGSDSSQMAWGDDMGELGWEASFSRPYGFFYIILIYFFWLCWVSVALPGLFSSCGVQASYRSGFFCCRARAQGHTGFREQAQELWRTGLVALQYVGSSWLRDRTGVSYTGRWILYH